MKPLSLYITGKMHHLLADLAPVTRAGELLLCDCDESHIEPACAGTVND